jgi:hypothetical protein
MTLSDNKRLQTARQIRCSSRQDRQLKKSRGYDLFCDGISMKTFQILLGAAALILCLLHLIILAGCTGLCFYD